MAERFNIQENRLDVLKQLKADAAMGKKRMSAKQHRELLDLTAAHNGFANEFDLQTTLRIIAHIEDLHLTESATSADLIRLEVLKDKILDE